MDIFKRSMKKWVGKGGWKCYCCRPWRKDHRKVRRYARRVMKNMDNSV